MNIFIKFFYLTLFILLYKDGTFYVNSNLENINFVLFAKPLNFFQKKEFLFPFFYISSFALLIINIIKLNSRTFYLLNFFILILISMKYSFGKISHSYHIWMTCCLLICLIRRNKSLLDIKNIWIIRTMQGLLLSTYFISGCWKVIEILKVPPTSIANLGLEHIAYASAEGNKTSDIIFKLMMHFPELIALGFFFVLIFQLSCIIPIITNKQYRKIFGLLEPELNSYDAFFVSTSFVFCK